ncbi:MarR family winged helix-turn-helix transcriptional regulator [Streptomyces sp. NBC_00872]|uniref:MarR family winged helix-turn-helix transcriptional regulator n=1 Tax=Streptomyces sp. NBC_00872 TaxID=2903686 RepID=UPI00386F9BD8|nr:MarR family transcriptional regulator [Streptomyces sp. NBC_00872]
MTAPDLSSSERGPSESGTAESGTAERAAPEPAEIAGRLRTAIQHLLPTLRTRTARGDLTPSRQAALATLAAHGPLRISDLATRMGIALSTVSRMVDLLDGSGWIERNTDPLDQRATLIALNDAGRALLDATRREAAVRLAEQIARLTPAEQRSLDAALPALEALSEHAASLPGELPSTI